MNAILRNSRGVTLVELMIATAILSVAVLGLVGGFAGIQKVVQISKTKTLAANLAQEQMQILSQLNYYQVLTTPSASFMTNVTPNIPYDPTYFPPQTVLQGGITYTWYTYIQVAMENNDAIVVMPPTTPDTGMKLVTITVAWSQGGVPKQTVVNSLLSNPNTVMTNSLFTGTFTNSATGAAISGGVADIAENMGWRDTTKASGVYSISASPGSYTLAASAPGYFSQYASVSIAQNETINTSFALLPMSSGTVTGTVWVDSTVVISQVVMDTYTYCQQPHGAYGYHDVEYIEFFNPTPNPIYMGSTGDSYYTNYNSLWFTSSSGGEGYEYHGGNSASTFDITYLNTTVPAYSYFLYANTPSFMINGIMVTADAYFTGGTGGTSDPDIPHYLSAPANRSASGYVQWGHWSGGLGPTIDSVGWSNSAGNFSGYLTPPLSTATIQNCNACGDATFGVTSGGNPTGNQLVRISSPAASAAGMTAFGHAYNSQDNQYDFLAPSASFSGIVYQPHNVSSGTFTVISGVPAVGAVITSNDALSNSTAAYSVGSPPVANFTLVGVATATLPTPWTVLITSGGYTLENDTVTIPTQGSVYNFPSSTTILNQESTQGFIAGYVTDTLGNPISAPSAIIVSGGGVSATASTANGRYLLRVSSGSVDVTANPGSANGDYVAVSSLAVSVYLGQVSDGVNFMLSQGGQISGFVTRDGVNALPGVAVSAIDSNGFSHDTEISNNAGYFTTVVIATGTYGMTPELDSIETASPSSGTVTITSGQILFSSTFTISSAMGVVTGTATLSGSPIASGVLIVVTTSTFAGSPPAVPAISSASLTASSYYFASSLEDGTYSVSVRQSTSPTYNLYGYYTTVTSTGGVAFQTKELTGISVLAGQTVSGKNLSW